MTVTLGFRPVEILVTLSRGGGFVQTLRSTKPWPAGAVVTLEFAATEAGAAVTTWTATLAEFTDPDTGVVYYDADHFPPEYRETLFIGNPITHRVNHDTLRAQMHGR